MMTFTLFLTASIEAALRERNTSISMDRMVEIDNWLSEMATKYPATYKDALNIYCTASQVMNV